VREHLMDPAASAAERAEDMDQLLSVLRSYMK